MCTNDKQKRGCLHCGGVVDRTNPRANNKKYCSQLCRNKALYIRKGGAIVQREYLNKRNGAHIPSKNKIQCEICGLWYRQVGSHVWNIHGMEAREYRYMYGFDVKRGQLPPDLREHKAQQVFENGTVDNLKKGAKYRFKKGQKGVGVYERSAQTITRLKQSKK